MGALRHESMLQLCVGAGQAVPFVALPMALGSFTFPRAASGCFFAAFILQSLAAQVSTLFIEILELMSQKNSRAVKETASSRLIPIAAAGKCMSTIWLLNQRAWVHTFAHC